MFNKKFIAAAVAVLAMASASAVPLTVTLNPQANNGGAGTLAGGMLGPSLTAFTADGATGTLGSSLTIGGYGLPGPVSYSETGTVQLTSFVGGTSGSSLGGSLLNPLFGYGVYATFTLSGFGGWTPEIVSSGPAQKFTAATANLTNAFVYGVTNGNPYTTTGTQAGQFLLGTLALNPAVGLISATALVTNGGTQAETSLSATFSFTPAPGTSGPNGFWSQPLDFNIDFFAANVGSGVGNTTLNPNPAVPGSPLTLRTLNYADGAIGGNGSFNLAFQTRTVPEPGALALVGLALAGIALVRRKKI